jgi:glycosyltransferase involved in cell wall biosynthesis
MAGPNEGRSPAFSRAGNMWMTNLLTSLVDAGLPPLRVLSFEPVPAFPRSKVLWVRRRHQTIAGIPVTLLPYINLPGIKLVQVGVQAFIFLCATGVRKTLRSRAAPKLVALCYNASLPFGPFVLLAARLTGAVAVVTLNDVFVPGELVPNNVWRRLDFVIMKSILPRFDGFIAVTDRIMSELAPGRTYVRVEGGIAEDLVRERFAGRQKSEEKFVIGVAGSLTKSNGILEILEAFQLLEGDKWRLRIAGTGPLNAEVEGAVARDQRIAWLGSIPFASVLDLYSEADVLINMRLTKRIKSDFFFPSKMMEYLASGTPVITTCTGHAEEEYGSFAFLVRDESAVGLARVVRQVASKPPDELRAYGARARSYMCANKSWRVQGRRIAEHIRWVARMSQAVRGASEN